MIRLDSVGIDFVKQKHVIDQSDKVTILKKAPSKQSSIKMIKSPDTDNTRNEDLVLLKREDDKEEDSSRAIKKTPEFNRETPELIPNQPGPNDQRENSYNNEIENDYSLNLILPTTRDKNNKKFL